MLMDIAGVSAEAARDALQRCNGRVKPAVLVAKGLTPDAAEQALIETGGSLRQALKRI
jgi:N-acetylmuramic acid 6-phosphate etherase